MAGPQLTLVRLLLLCTGLIAPAAALAETRALLIGVSRYQSPAMPDLAGPANDLPAMEALARNLGARDVRTLKDAEVTRTSVETALQEIGGRAQPGDWFLLYYSGHGAQAQAQAQARSDADGRYDQFVPLPGFDPAKQDTERFIVDKDFYAWLKLYVPADVRILMVVDSCHSGSMYRAVDPRRFAFAPRVAFRSGEARSFQLVPRPGPRLTPLRREAAAPLAEVREDLQNLVYIGASRDDQLALETELPQAGAPHRGVLTFALEQGLTVAGSDDTHAAADLDGDAVVTTVELSSYLNSQVRLLSANRQESTAYFPSSWSELPILEARPSARARPAAPPPSLFVLGAMPAEPSGDAPFRLLTEDATADFIWDVPRGEIVRRSGDLVASDIRTVTALTGVLDKWATINQLLPLVSELPAHLTVDPSGSDFVYAPGTAVTIALRRTRRGSGQRFATVFNIASDGTVQLLFPLAPDGDGRLPDNADLPVLQSDVVPPFGLDHVVALTGPEDMAGLRAALRSADGQRAAGRLVSVVRAELKRVRGRGSLSIAELYTGR